MDIFFLGEWLRLEGIEMMGSSGKRKIEVRLFGQQEEDRVETGFWAELEKW